MLNAAEPLIYQSRIPSKIGSDFAEHICSTVPYYFYYELLAIWIHDPLLHQNSGYIEVIQSCILDILLELTSNYTLPVISTITDTFPITRNSIIVLFFI